MQAAAQQFVGRHDFLALCATGSSAAAHGDTVRTITDCHVTRKGNEIDIEVTADGYLYNMVRILVGTLCEAGAGRLDPAEIPAILASRDRSRAGPTLPAKGLFLKCVEYGDAPSQAASRPALPKGEPLAVHTKFSVSPVALPLGELDAKRPERARPFTITE